MSVTRRLAIWIPSVVVLALLLFHIEASGLVSHLFQRSVISADHYRIALPLTWIIEREGQDPDGLPYFWALAGKGLARGWNTASWGYGRKAIAEVEAHHFKGEKDPQWRLHSFYSDLQPVAFTLAVHGGSVVCGEGPLKAGFTRADCLGKAKASDSIIWLHFYGREEMLLDFYSFVQDDVSFY